MDNQLLNSFIIILVFDILLDIGTGQFYECPSTWMSFQQKCYYFNYYPELDYSGAVTACSQNGAFLVSINTAQEHQFIVQQLKVNDAQEKQWYTSGSVNNLDTGDLSWDGDRTLIQPDVHRWLSEQDKMKEGSRIVYKSEGGVYGWSRVLPTVTLPFICEISRTEAFRIDQENRDFSYGSNLTDSYLIPRGPVFTLQPQSIIVIANARTPIEGEQETVTIECFADGNPLPSYRILHTTVEGTDVEISSAIDSRYTLVGGRLVITDPEESTDAGTYQCLAYNDYGSALSDTANITFGALSEFSNVQRAPVIAQEYLGVAIECDPPTYKPAVTYQWYRASDGDFVRPDLNHRAFISSNGKLYFSEVTPSDGTDYICLVKLASASNAILATEQSPSRVSLPIPLQVNSQASISWGPEFVDGFIAVFPSQPVRGNMVKLECLAYGTLPLTYSWTRKDYPIPERAVIIDNNRILEIADIQLEDEGTYTCSVSRTTGEIAQRSQPLIIEAKPYFVFPLQHQHADVGSQLTWHCEAKAIPTPVYFWYRNGEELRPTLGELEIRQNVLIIYNLNAERHNGMYQCAAYNVHGISYSSAQLRVLAFKPSFVKRPLNPSQSASLGGSVTIICSPEAAPKPEYIWSKDGIQLNLPDEDGIARVRKLRNGNLFITEVQYGDAGRYGCEATNQFGSDLSFGSLQVVPNTVITVPPINTIVRINSSALFLCEASFPPDIDHVYFWRFNGRDIDFTNHPHYRLDSQQPGEFYITTAQYFHSGTYACVAKTTHDEVVARASLAVIGPPGESAGVTVDPSSTTSTSTRLFWTRGSLHGRPVDYHIIEGRTEHNNNWTVLMYNVPNSVSQILGTEKHSIVVEPLKPGNGYYFRIGAVNGLGVGRPSKSTAITQTPGAAPSVYPRNVSGGGGSVGTLTITWDPLPPENQGGPGIGYIVKWRLKQTGTRLEEAIVEGNKGRYTHTVGRENFYLQYEVSVTAYNIYGQGPSSPAGVFVYSAEDLPIGVATNVYAWPYNSTAIYVSWAPIPNDRINMRGALLGYQVNYKERFDTDPIINAISWRGESDTGIVIGLDPYIWYTVDVQVLNTAGMGPRSEYYHAQTYRAAPSLYPIEVYVYSHTIESVIITWRGVSTKADEEALEGYKIRYWQTTDDIRSATDVLVDRGDTEVRVWGIQRDTVYELRLMGYSRGGDGKMSEASFFTLGGTVAYDPSSSEIFSTATRPTYSVVFIILLFLTRVQHAFLIPMHFRM